MRLSVTEPWLPRPVPCIAPGGVVVAPAAVKHRVLNTAARELVLGRS